MTPRILLVAAATLAAFAAPPALANDSTYSGGCGYDSVKTLPANIAHEDPGNYTGVVYFAIALTSGSDTHVVEADVSCELRVNGVTQDRLGPVPVTGAGVAADLLTFHAYDLFEEVWLCEVVTFHDGTPPVDDCGAKLAICDTYCVLMEQTQTQRRQAESDACARLGAQAPGLPGLVDVTPEGDAYAGGVWLVDCPPYGPYE